MKTFTQPPFASTALAAYMGMTMMATSADLDVVIADLTAKVDAQTTVDASAAALLSGLSAALTAALAAAAAAGATPAQLASFTALRDRIDTNNTALADAVSANTQASTSP